MDEIISKLAAYEIIEKLCKEEALKPYEERDSDELVAEIIAKLIDEGATFNKYFNLNN